MVKLTHIDLVKLGNTLGYPLNKEGLCQGFSGMLSQAWLANDAETFFKRLDFIETYNNDFNRLKADIDQARQLAKKNHFSHLDEKTTLLLEIPAFYEGIELYLMPHRHTDLFATDTLSQGNIDTIYSFVRPEQLEQDDASIVLNKPYVFFGRSDLINYLEDLKKALGSQGSTAPIFLSSAEHTVSLRYNEQKKKWEYVDTNDFSRYSKHGSYLRELDSEALAASIFESFGCSKHTVFNTTILTQSNKNNDLKIKLDKFDKHYPITPEQAGALHLACVYGNLNVVRELLTYPYPFMDVNYVENNGTTPLFMACQNGHSDVVRELLKHKNIQINQARNDGVKPLFMACHNGHSDVVRELLKHKNIQINQARNDGATPLFIACQQGNLDVVRELLKHKNIQINQTINDGATPLFIACQQGNLDVVRELLKHKDIQVNQAKNYGATPLFMACQNGHLNVVRELLKHKDIQINQADNNGTTPLDMASYKKHSQIIELLTQFKPHHQTEPRSSEANVDELKMSSTKDEPYNLTPRIFAHVNLDSRLLGSHLKGSNFKDTIGYILYAMRSISEHEQDYVLKKKLEKLTKEFEPLLHIETEINHVIDGLTSFKGKIYSSEEIKKFINPIAKSILTQLEIKDDILVPGGWLAKQKGGSGHAMMYQFQKQADGSCRFIVYNTGAGLEYHLKQSDLKKKYTPLKAYQFSAPKTEADKEKLQQFIVELLMPQIAPLLKTMWKKDKHGYDIYDLEWDKKATYNQKRVYEEAINKVHLLDNATQLNPQDITHVTTKGQVSGTCAMRVLMPLLSEKLGKEAFKQFSYRLELKSIQDYFNQQKLTLENPHDPNLPMVRRQLLHAIERLANSIQHMEERRELSHAEAENALDRLDVINAKLKTYQIAQNTKKRPSTQLQQLDASFDYDKSKIHQFESVPESEPIAQKAALLKMSKQQDYPNPLKFLQTAYERSHFNHQEGHHEAVKTQIETLFLEFDLNNRDYWQNLSEENAKDALTYLQCILRIYGENCRQLNPNRSARQAITGYTGQLMAYEIALRCFSRHQEAFEPVMATVLFDKNSIQGINAVSLDPDFDRRLKQINDIHQEIYEKHKDELAKDYEKRGDPKCEISHQNLFDEVYWTEEINQTEQEQLINTAHNYTSSSTVEQRRLNLYEGLGATYVNPNEEPLPDIKKVLNKVEWDKHIKKYNTFMQFEAIKQECRCYNKAKFDAFKDENIIFEAVQSQNQTSNLHINKISDKANLEPLNYQSTYSTTHKFTHANQAHGDRPSTVKNPLALTDPDLRGLLYNETGLHNHDYSDDSDYAGDTYLIYPRPGGEQQSFNFHAQHVQAPFLQTQLASLAKSDNKYLIHWQRLQQQAANHIPRDLLSTCSNPDTIPIATKDFFEAHLELLNQEDYQKIALVNLFTPGVLEKQLFRTPEFALDLVHFLKKIDAYHNISEHEELSSAGVFTFELSYFLLKYLKQHEPKAQPIDQAINEIEHFNKQLMHHVPKETLENTPKETVQMHHKLRNINFLMHSLSEKSSLDKKELEEVLLSFIQPPHEDPILVQETTVAKQKIMPLIQVSLKPLTEQERQSLKEGVKTQLPSSIRPKPNEKFNIELPSGKIQFTKGVWIVTPQELIQNDSFKKLFGNTIIDVKQRVSGHYAIHEFDQNGIAYRILLHQKTGGIRVQRKISNESKWFELIETKNAPSVSSRYNDSECMWWCETETSPNTLPSYYCLSHHIGSKDQVLLQFKPNVDNTDLICLSHEPNKQGTETAYQFLPYKDGANKSIYEQFTSFESLEHIEVWRTTNTPYELKIKLPRYGLEWDAKEVVIDGRSQIKFFWSENKEYQLLVEQPEVIEGFSHTLHMYNEKTKETIALIPKQEFYVKDLEEHDGEYYAMHYDLNNTTPKTILEERLKLDHLSWNVLKSQQYGQFTIENNKLVGHSPCDWLHIAYLALAKHDSEQAMAALRQCKDLGGIKGTEEEVALIMKIMVGTPNQDYNEQHYQEAQTKEPETLAIRLHAATLLAEQKEKSFNTPEFSQETKEKPITGNKIYAQYVRDKVSEFYSNKLFVTCVNDIYRSYHHVKGAIPEAMQLNKNESLSLLQKINPDENSILNNELNTLKLLHEKEILKPLLKKQAQDNALNSKEAQRLNECKKKIDDLHSFKRCNEYIKERTENIPPPKNGNCKENPDQKTIVSTIAARLFEYYQNGQPPNAPSWEHALGMPLLDKESLTHNFGSLYETCRNLSSSQNDNITRAKLQGQLEKILKMEALSPSMSYLTRLLVYVLRHPQVPWPKYEDHFFKSQYKRTIDFTAGTDFFHTIETFCSTLTVGTIQTQKIHSTSTSYPRARDEKEFKFAVPESIEILNLSILDQPQTNHTLQNFLTNYQQYEAQQRHDSEEKSNFIDKEFPIRIEKQESRLARERDTAKKKKQFIQSKYDFYKEHLDKSSVQNDLFQHFRAFIEHLERDLGRQKKNLITYANSKIETRKAPVLSKNKTKVTFPDLIGLYLQGDRELYKEKTLLDEEHITQLHSQIHKYLMDSTANQSNTRTFDLLNKIKQLRVANKENSQDYQESLIKLGEALSAPPHHFEPREHREMLVFEFLEQASFRQEQVETIQALVEPRDEGFNNMISQLKMGAGKSKFMLPILAVAKAKGTNLSIVELPSHLFETGRSDLMKTTQQNFGKIGFPLIFDRSKNSTSTALEALYNRLKSLMADQEYLVTTPESIQSLQLKYLELLNKPFSLSDEEEKQVIQLERILRLIKECGDVLIDECDTVLDSKRDLNYTLGSPSTVPNDRLATILTIYDSFKKSILTADNKKITLEDVLLRKVALSTEKDWHDAMESLATTLLEDPNGLLLFVPSEKRPELLDYLLNRAPAIPKYVDELDTKQQNTVALIKGELDLLKTTLRKKPNESYGFPRSADYSGNKHLAIPYKSNNEPNERSQFASVYEIINYTIQLHKREGTLPTDIVQAFLNDFRAKAKSELKENPDIKLEETQAANEFFNIMGKPLQLRHSDKYTTHIQDLLHHKDSAFNYILQHYLLNRVTQHSHILSSNAINHVDQFRSAQGFTGTPWNAHCYHPKLHFDEKKYIGIDGETMNLLGEKKATVSFFGSTSPNHIIEEMIEKQEDPEKIRAFLDIGAIFDGKSNLDMALLFAQYFKNSKEIKHILFFDENHILCSLDIRKISAEREKDTKEAIKKAIIVIGSTDPKTIEQKTGVSPRERFTYYDQSHTTGIDIQQADDVVGIATIDLDTKARDCWQGVMRLMRKEPSKQKVNFILPNRVLSKEINHHKKTDPKTWTIDDVIHLVQENQDKILDDLHLHAALDKMNNVVRQYCFEKIENCTNVEEKNRLVKRYDEIFIALLVEEPYKQFRGIEQTTNTTEILETHKESCLQKITRLLGQSSLNKEIKENLSNIVNESLEYCSGKYQWQSYNLQKGLQVGVEKQAQKQEEAQKQKEKMNQRELEYITATPYHEWNTLPYIGDRYPSIALHHKSSAYPYMDPCIAPLNVMITPSSHNIAFSKHIWVSENYMNTYYSQTNPLDNFVKPETFFLLRKDPHSSELNALLITSEELRQFTGYLDEYKKSGIKQDFWIVSSHGVVQNATQNAITPSDPLYQNYSDLLSQIQFYNGDLDLCLKHKNLTWFHENLHDKLDFLDNVVLSNYPEKRKHLQKFKEKIQGPVLETPIREQSVEKPGVTEETQHQAAEKQVAKEAQRNAVEQPAAEEAQRNAVEQSAAEEAQRNAAEQSAAEEAQRNTAEQSAAEETQPKATKQPTAEEIQLKTTEQPAIEETQPKATEQPAIEETQPKATEQPAIEETQPKATEQPAEEETQPKATEQPAAEEQVAKEAQQKPEEQQKNAVEALKQKHKKVVHWAPELEQKQVYDPKEEQRQNRAVHKVTNKYKYGDDVNRGRFHLFKAHFKDFKGDYLKNKILEEIKKRIEETSSKKDLDDLKKEIRNSDEYKVLAKGQGLVTRIAQKINESRMKTSSIKALESMFAEQEKNLENKPKHK